ncbi:MAG TPA: LpqB family beta-propeller domain-containing protein [Microlunatus sp.]|nr:LpqB family beta-propeller domain-containing protein [Microlunatus sp.]
MEKRRSRPALAVLLALLLTALTACTELPTSGSVDPVENLEPTCRGCLNVDPVGPRPGDDPKTIVDGFLQAMASYEPTYATARKYLTEQAAQSWNPDQGTTIYRGQLAATSPTSIVLDGQMVGTLDPFRNYNARVQRIRQPFGLIKEAGQWRINRPPPGLFVPEATFNTFYDPYNLYFIGRDGTLVPDPIYLPQQANISSALVVALLNGPSSWLKPVVRTAFPINTTLNVQSVTVTPELNAEVQLSDAVNQLNDQARAEMAAQVAYTLRQAQIRAVRFLVNGEIYRVPGADAATGLISVTDDQVLKKAAIPTRASDQLFAASGHGVDTLGAGGKPARVDGPLGGRRGIDRVAVSVNGRDLAAVTNDRTALRRQLDGGDSVTLIRNASDLLRPQFSRQNELWAVGMKDGRQHIWVADGDRVIEVDAPSVIRDKIVAFRLSPDGSRMALIREVGSSRQLGMVRIKRWEGKITIDGWRALDTDANQGASSITQFRDVGWHDDSHLVVIGSAGPQSPVGVYTVAQDASEINVLGELSGSDAADAVEIATSPAHNQVALLTRDGAAYQLDAATSWRRIGDQTFSALAYPG